MNGPMPGDPVFALESLGTDQHVEMALYAFGETSVSTVALGIIHDLEHARSKSRF